MIEPVVDRLLVSKNRPKDLAEILSHGSRVIGDEPR
jgi:hypothetical protein